MHLPRPWTSPVDTAHGDYTDGATMTCDVRSVFIDARRPNPDYVR